MAIDQKSEKYRILLNLRDLMAEEECLSYAKSLVEDAIAECLEIDFVLEGLEVKEGK